MRWFVIDVAHREQLDSARTHWAVGHQWMLTTLADVAASDWVEVGLFGWRSRVSGQGFCAVFVWV